MDIANVTSTAFDFLIERIIMGVLKPGQKLNETNLSQQLGISRPPLREAFRLLERYNFVINIPRKGTYVVGLSVEDYEEILQIRELIECFAIDHLKAANIRNLPNVKESLKNVLNLTVDTNDPGQILENAKAMLDFHIKLVETSRNARLINIYNAICVNLLRYQFVYFSKKSSPGRAYVLHDQILQIIQKGDYDHAKEELSKHIRSIVEVVKKEILRRNSKGRAE